MKEKECHKAAQDVQESSSNDDPGEAINETLTPRLYNKNADAKDDSHADSTSSLPTRDSTPWNPFTAMYSPSEARSELEEEKTRMQTPIPKKTVVIRLGEPANKNGSEQFTKKITTPVIKSPQKTQVVIHLPDEPARQSNVQFEPDTSVVMRPTSPAISAPAPSIELVDKTANAGPNALRNPEHGNLRSISAQSSNQRPHIIPAAIEKRISSMRERLRSADSRKTPPESQKTENVSSEEPIYNVLSMSAEDRILLMRGRQRPDKSERTDKLFSSEWEAVAADNSVAHEGEGSKPVEGDMKFTIPIGFSEYGKNVQKAKEWTVFKRKGWELIHKAESMRYIGT